MTDPAAEAILRNLPASMQSGNATEELSLIELVRGLTDGTIRPWPLRPA